MEEKNPVRLGVYWQDNLGHFLLGININVGNAFGAWQYYICIYLGFKTLAIRKNLPMIKIGGE